jgi:hypothetical protein
MTDPTAELWGTRACRDQGRPLYGGSSELVGVRGDPDYEILRKAREVAGERNRGWEAEADDPTAELWGTRPAAVLGTLRPNRRC